MATVEEVDRLLAELRPADRLMYEDVRANGPSTMNVIVRRLGKERGGWTTAAMRRLQRVGLIRTAGRVTEPGSGRKTRVQFTVVPLAQVERAAQDHAAFERKRKKKRAPASRIAELRSKEKGEFGAWYAVRTHVLEMGVYARMASEMAGWEVIPEHDIAEVLEELEDTRDAIEDAIAGFLWRAGEDAVKEKVEKLRRTNGRTPAEAATALRLADRLEAKLAAG